MFSFYNYDNKNCIRKSVNARRCAKYNFLTNRSNHVFVANLARDQDGPVRQADTSKILFRWRRARGCDRRRDERKRRRAAVAGKPATTGGSFGHGQDQGHSGHRGESAASENTRVEAVSSQIARMYPLTAAHFERSISQSGELRRIEKSKLEWR